MKNNRSLLSLALVSVAITIGVIIAVLSQVFSNIPPIIKTHRTLWAVAFAYLSFILGWALARARMSIIEHSICALGFFLPLVFLVQFSPLEYLIQNSPINLWYLHAAAVLLSPIPTSYFLFFMPRRSSKAAFLMLPMAALNGLIFIVPIILLFMLFFGNFS